MSNKSVKELIRLGTAFLEKRGIPDARTLNELLWARLLKCRRLDLHPYHDTIPQERLVAAIRRGLRRISQGEPIQYVLGEWDFRKLTLKVDERALIPRPETEQLVDLALSALKEGRIEKPLVVDVGTGTGCIVLSLALEFGRGVFVGIDKSPDAIALARENARLAGLEEKVVFAESDGCGEFDPASVDLLVSNPPYIASGVVDTLEPHIRDYEPRMALDGGKDGLDVIRSLLLDAVMVLKPGGALALEIGDDQGEVLRNLLEDYGFGAVGIHHDLAGRPRFATALQQS